MWETQGKDAHGTQEEAGASSVNYQAIKQGNGKVRCFEQKLMRLRTGDADMSEWDCLVTIWRLNVQSLPFTKCNGSACCA